MLKYNLCLALLITSLGALAADEPRPNAWRKLPKANIAGQRWDIPVAFAPELGRFVVLGGRTNYREYREEGRPYDQLALDLERGQWENWFPPGKDWGPTFGLAQAPPWKDELWRFQDAEGNTRPNWTVYGTFLLGQAYDYDPLGKRFIFYAKGKTFSYDPERRTWTDLQPARHPMQDQGGILLWTSLCYDPVNKAMLLFGGGNVQSERGDSGTWSYDPAKNTWTQLELDNQPPPRANSRMAYDPQAKKIVLFGGDRLDELLADTWTFDVTTRQWERQELDLSPSPRGGHALLWLPVAKKLLLLGGYDYASEVGYVGGFYRLPQLEMWTYDVAANRWELIKHFEEEDKEVPGGASPALYAYTFLSATVDDKDNVLVVNRGNTWLCKVDAGQKYEIGRALHGVKPGTVTRRTGPYDPAWYQQDVPKADPESLEKELAALPSNQWLQRKTPKLPRPNVDWGSAVFAPELDLILRYSGGHSAYCGTAPHIYDVKTDRYSIPFAPEIPLEYFGTNDQVSGEWSFQGNPWMTGHTYKATGYDPRLRCLVFAAHQYTYFFDPATSEWSRSNERNPHDGSCFTVTLCSTPEGTICWAEKRDRSLGLWRLDTKGRSWQELPVAGPLPAQSPDCHGMAYDSKRNRLLLFSSIDKRKGDVLEYDLKTGESAWLNASGKDRAAVPSRETVYLPEQDAVLIGARVQIDARWCWLVYDCAKNAWYGLDLRGDDPIEKESFNNSIGVMYDPNRKLVWAAGQNSHIHVMRPDCSHGLTALKQ